MPDILGDDETRNASRQRWEYLVVDHDVSRDERLELMLARHGASGWELVQVMTNPYGHQSWTMRYLFKRVAT